MKQLKIKNLVRTRIPTGFGEFQLYYYQNNFDNKEHLALVLGNVASHQNVVVRIHSECFTGDVLGSLRCDCGLQLKNAMNLITDQGIGVILYLRQEGRGIGLLDKLRAYNLQDEGYDTVDANLKLGHQPDERDYSIAAKILQDLEIKSLQLITNNPSKINSLEKFGFTISKRIPSITSIHSENEAYIKTKAERMDHILNLNSSPINLPKIPKLNFDKNGNSPLDRTA